MTRPSRVDAPTLDRALAMRAEGRPVRAIAMALRVPRSTIARALAASQKGAPTEPADPPAI